MIFDEYAADDGLGLAALVRAGEVTPTELLELDLSRLARVNPVLNVVVHRMDDEARETAAALMEAEATDDRRATPDNGEPETWALAATGRRMGAARYARHRWSAGP